MLSRNNYEFRIFTDDVTQPACRTCTCVAYDPPPCECPRPKLSGCHLCKKLEFVITSIKNMHEFIFVDSDFLILNDTFMPALEARAAHFDFLATYNFMPPASLKFLSSFNSGLMFLRRIDGLNYDEMRRIMHRQGFNNDQNTISMFIHRYYVRWDTFSLRWHCRFLDRPENNIEVHACIGFHAKRKAREVFLKERNFSLLTTESTSP